MGKMKIIDFLRQQSVVKHLTKWIFKPAEICGGRWVIFPGSGGLISYGLPSLDQLKKPHSMFDKVVVRNMPPNLTCQNIFCPGIMRNGTSW